MVNSLIDPFECLIKNDIVNLTNYLESGNINVLDRNGLTLLDYAIRLHNNEAFKLLVRNFINVDIKDKYGNTAYHYAVINNRLVYLKHLLELPGDHLALNNQGQSPLYLACLYGRDDMVSLYLEKYQLDLNEKDNHDETIFMALVRSRNLALLQRFNYDYKLIEEANYFGDTPLSIAVSRDSNEMAKFLLDRNAFVNVKNHNNETPLFYAVRNDNYQLLDALLKNGAIVDVKNNIGETIFDLEMSEDVLNYINEKIVVYHLKEYPKLYPLHYGIIMNDKKLIESALLVGNINREDPYGYTPMSLAKEYKNREIIKILKEYSKVAKVILIENRII